MEIVMITKEQLRSYLIHRRPGVTSDEDWGQLTVIKEYEHLPIKGKVILDIGGNIGAMAIRCAVEGCKHVYTYEPEPSNFHMLSYNTYPWAEVITPTKAAVTVLPTGTEIELWLTNERTMGSCSTTEFRGRKPIPITTVNFHQEMLATEPDGIKLDCEGEEWSLLRNTKLLDSVKDVVAELHFTKKHWRTDYYPQTLDVMMKQGFRLIREPKNTGKNFHTIAHWRRE
jgi:FkbM family methyltransferase